MSVSHVEARETMIEQTVLSLWNKGLTRDQIEAETGIDIDKIEDICEQNYGRRDETLSKL